MPRPGKQNPCPLPPAGPTGARRPTAATAARSLAFGLALALVSMTASPALAAPLAPGAGPSAALSAPSTLIASEAAHGAHASQPAPTAAASGSTRACSAVTIVGKKSCFALKRNGMHAEAAAVSPDAIPAGYGYGPSQLQSAYNLTSASASDGAGRTIAIVDAYDDANAASDLAAYRSAAGLPAVPSFKKVNQNGAASPLPSAPPSGDDWTLEESLDLDMVSAACPLCNIVLVEATSDSGNGLYTAENSAANLAGYVSNSWGSPESSSDTTYDSEYFNHPGDVITASAGDSGYGVEYPATSPNVVAVGGTSLSTASNSRGWTESVWNTTTGSQGTGSGCSAYEPKPSWQTSLNLPSGCSKRIDNDVAADADPNTGVAVYDTSNGNGGWNEVGGTSASSPFLAATYALAGHPGNAPTDDIYTHTGNFYDLTSGINGSCSPAYLCTAKTGYDGPTGIGTPAGIAGLQTGSSTGNAVKVTAPGNQTGTVGTAASLQIKAADSASGQTLTYSATNLPAGLSINSSGLISGTPTAAAVGSESVTVTAKDTTGASGSASFTWTIKSSSTCSPTTDVVKNPNFANGSTAWTASSGVIGQWGSDGEPPIGGSNDDAWLDGYAKPHTDTLSQSVTLPSGCSGTLEVWLHIDSAQTSGTNGSFTISVAGKVIGTYTNLNANTGYTEHSFSVPASDSGRAITLLFTGVENNSNNTDYAIGQVELLA